ncbi:hypothetical protein A7A08_01889 [Methyloligella halotolerans]|uniref:DUF3828 domain-containing protein n=1 Tax=Methyloligella halotolerans TaxID=1177755 RepID=A0A1E2RY39_9HYPH|nr:hypothetical protein [Methyloligella halotolerans]ODA67143.1 hypothetical protein A7A08_01889 [Methyloligella halotolerans]
MRVLARLSRTCVALCLLVLFYSPAYAADDHEAVALVQGLYEAQAKLLAEEGMPLVKVPRVSTRYFDPFVAGQLDAKDIGFDPIYDAQDYDVSDVRVALDPEMPELRGTTFVQVHFKNFGTERQLTYLLRPMEGGGPLRVIDIESADWRLSDLLKAN